MNELSYKRVDIRRRHKLWVDKMRAWKEDVYKIIELLLEQGQEEKARNWTILYHSMDVLIKLWDRLVKEL